MSLSQRADGCSENRTQLQPSAVNSRPHGIGRQFTRGRDLVAAEPADLAEEKDVAIEVGQRCQRLPQRKRHLLVRVCRSLSRGAEVCLRAAAALAMVVKRNVSGNLEQPAGQLVLRRSRNGSPADPEKHFLCQIARGLTFACGAAEIPNQAVVVLRKERLGIGHGCHVRHL